MWGPNWSSTQFVLEVLFIFVAVPALLGVVLSWLIRRGKQQARVTVHKRRRSKSPIKPWKCSKTGSALTEWLGWLAVVVIVLACVVGVVKFVQWAKMNRRVVVREFATKGHSYELFYQGGDVAGVVHAYDCPACREEEPSDQN